MAQIRNAETLRTQGFYEKAIVELKNALILAKENPELSSLAMSDLGNLFQLTGYLEEAHRYLDSARQLAKKANRPDLEAAALNNLGNLAQVENKPEEALGFYASSRRLAVQAGKSGLEIQTLINAARASDGVKAASFLAEAWKATRALPGNHEKAYDLIAIGQLFSDIPSAYAALDEALKISGAIGDKRSESYALGFIGHLYEQEQRQAEALDLTRRAIFVAEQLEAPEILYRWYWQKGRLLKSQGKIDEAIAAYRQSVDRLQAIKNDLAQRYSSGQSSFRKVFSPLFFELADLLLVRASSAGGKEAEQYLEEARETIEKSKTAELQDYFQDSCVTALQSRIVKAGSFGAHTAIIYPVLLENRLELLVNFPNGIRQFSVPVSSLKITEEIRLLRTLLEKRTTRQYLPHAQKLYEWIIAPYVRELESNQIDTLVFVPDGPLRTIPMAALHDGKKFVIESYALATTPGLTLTDPHPLQKKDLKVLVNGLTESVQGFSALPNVSNEVQSIKGQYKDATVLQDQNYDLKNVREKLGATSYSVVHIASHGQFKGDTNKTFLLTHDEKLTLNQLEKLIAPSRFSAEPLELLTLSACQTAAGDDRAALGLAGVAIKAGARSALASLWFINDSSSSLLIAGFYDHLRETDATKAKALQKAQIDLIRDNRYSHPGYWAPFLLIGNWL